LYLICHGEEELQTRLLAKRKMLGGGKKVFYEEGIWQGSTWSLQSLMSTRLA
jgi:hypothetical protein